MTVSEATLPPRHPERSFAFLRSRRVLGWLQVAASVVVLSATLAAMNVERFPERLASARVPWLLVGVALIGAEIVLMATRWWYLAHRLGVGLSYRHAIAEYGLSTLLNQVLPGGIAGDAVRGVRHHRGVVADRTLERAGTRVVLTLMLDRFSGQLATWAVIVATLPGWWMLLPAGLGERLLLVGVPLIAGVVLALAWTTTRRWRWRAAVEQVWHRSGRAAFTGASSVVHLSISLLLVGLHVGVFWAVAASLDVELELSALLRIVPLLLLVSSLPAFFAGWGVREAAAAALFQLSRLAPGDGASISMIFGVVSLAGSLPGLLAIRRRRIRRTEVGSKPHVVPEVLADSGPRSHR